MNVKRLNRREFLKGSLTATSALLLGASAALPQPNSTPAKRTAVDQVTLGQTGIKLSRLGMGTGSNSGQVQFELGRETFNGLVHYAYDQGITYFDCSQTYQTFEWIGGALKGECLLSTSGGDVSVTVDKAAAFQLDASTSGGRVRADGLTITLDGGGAGRSHLSGKVNGGGPLLKLRTSGGDIKVEPK